MHKNRLEAFSDGVLAIIITIMVLELKAPASGKLEDLERLWPVFLSYLLSFLYVAIYWNNHHHMLHTVTRVSAGILWANMHLLFWLSLFPFTTAWVGGHHDSAIPTAVYGGVLLAAAIAYFVLQQTIIRHQGEGSLLAAAVGQDWKGKLSLLVYLAAIPLAFVKPWISNSIYLAVALVWVIPDRRIERTMDRLG